jgi:hypothetical protein
MLTNNLSNAISEVTGNAILDRSYLVITDLVITDVDPDSLNQGSIDLPVADPVTIIYQAALRRGTRDRHGYFLKKVSGYVFEGVDAQGWATICTRSGSCHEVDNSALHLHEVKR